MPKLKTDNPMDKAHGYIVAWDFDCTITSSHGIWPGCGKVRDGIINVINFLDSIGMINVVWTCREGESLNNAAFLLGESGAKIKALNHSYKFCPFEYESRKIYAHVYIDDRCLGWPKHLDDLELSAWILHQTMTMFDIQLKQWFIWAVVNGEEIDNGTVQQIEDLLHGRWEPGCGGEVPWIMGLRGTGT